MVAHEGETQINFSFLFKTDTGCCNLITRTFALERSHYETRMASELARSTSRQDDDPVTVNPSWQGSTQSTSKVDAIISVMRSKYFETSHEDISRILACVTDYWLPILSYYTLPPDLDPSINRKFIEQQSSVLDPAFELDGQHYNLDTNASVPEGKKLPHTIEYKKVLGQGGFAYVAQVSDKKGRVHALKVITRKKILRRSQGADENGQTGDRGSEKG